MYRSASGTQSFRADASPAKNAQAPRPATILFSSFGPENFGPKGWKGEERPARFVPTELAEFAYLLAQDVRRIPEVQKGIESACFRGARLSELENRIRHYLAEIDPLIRRKT
jgi:hypothetical protein